METITTKKGTFNVLAEINTQGKLSETYSKLLTVKKIRGKKTYMAGITLKGNAVVICDSI